MTQYNTRVPIYCVIPRDGASAGYMSENDVDNLDQGHQMKLRMSTEIRSRPRMSVRIQKSVVAGGNWRLSTSKELPIAKHAIYLPAAVMAKSAGVSEA